MTADSQKMLEEAMESYLEVNTYAWVGNACWECGKDPWGEEDDFVCESEYSDECDTHFDPYALKFTFDQEGGLMAVHMQVAGGGPTIWVVAHRGGTVYVEGSWWFDNAKMRAPKIDGDVIVEHYQDNGMMELIGERIAAWRP